VLLGLWRLSPASGVAQSSSSIMLSMNMTVNTDFAADAPQVPIEMGGMSNDAD